MCGIVLSFEIKVLRNSHIYNVVKQRKSIMIDNFLNEQLICLDLKSSSKAEVFAELVDLLVKNGNVSDKEQFLADVNAREAVSNTGFEEGVAFPHAKSSAVATPGVAVGISRTLSSFL
jgi:PTS system fructose-specific IIC component